MKKWVAMLLAIVTLLLFIPSVVMAEEVAVSDENETVIEQSETVPDEDELPSEEEQAAPQEDLSDETVPDTEPEKEEVTPESEPQKDKTIPEQEKESSEEDQPAPQQDPSAGVSDEGEPEEKSSGSGEENDSEPTGELFAAEEPVEEKSVPEEVIEPEQDTEESETEEVQAAPEQDLSDDNTDESEPVKEETAPVEIPAEKAPALRAPKAKNGWVQEDGEWHYYENGVAYTGWAKDSRYWYYCEEGRPYSGGVLWIDNSLYGFASDGHMLTGWQKINGSWYFFSADGKGKTGWVQDSQYWYYCEKGRPFSGVRWISGARYGFATDGHMVTGWQKIDGNWYYFSSDGKGYSGWVKDGNYWCFCEDGIPYKNKMDYMDGYMYAFNDSCHMVTGWYSREEYWWDSELEQDVKRQIWYYFDSDGKGHTGWIKDSNNWYYCEDGSIRRNGVYEVDHDRYAFDADGHMITGWYSRDEYWWDYELEQDVKRQVWYYFDSDGKGHTGWIQDGKYWSYCVKGSIYRDCVQWIANEDATYGFDTDGHMVTGWFARNEYWWDSELEQDVKHQIWYYFDSNGKGHNGWVSDTRYKYYCSGGSTYRDDVYWIDEDDTRYAFDTDGHMVTGWYSRDEYWWDDELEQSVKHQIWYYFDSDGKGHNGWVKDTQNWYYCTDGALYKGTRSVDGVRYAFDDSDGHMLTGWYEEDWGDGTDWYYFDSNGKGHQGYLTYNGKKYYINNGYMLYSCIYDCDGECRQIGSDGVVGDTISGWKKNGNVWYYANSDGSTKTGWLNYNGKWYYFDRSRMISNRVYKCNDGKMYAFDKDGVYLTMVKGFYDFTVVYTNEDGTTESYIRKYYANSDGTPYNGWLKKNGKWYYVNNSYVETDTTYYFENEDNRYGFADDGHMVTGWFKQAYSYYDYDDQLVEYTEWYYFDSDGKGHNGWLKDNGYWYYCSKGYMYKDTVIEIDGAHYAFDEKGHMVTGWYSDSYYYRDENGNKVTHTEWYYFDSNGKGHNGWLQDGKYRSYCQNGRAYSDGFYTVDNERYAFDADAHLVTGWYSDKYYYYDENGNRVDHTEWYYFDDDGTAHEGWLQYNGSWYYFDSYGEMYSDCVAYIYKFRAYYCFDSQGRMVTGWKYIDRYHNGEKEWYYFEANGKGHDGLINDSAHTYYCVDGRIVKDETVYYKGETYYCNDNGYASIVELSDD